METDVDVGQVYKVRVGFQSDGEELGWFSNFAGSPTWYLERVRHIHSCISDVRDFIYLLALKPSLNVPELS